MNITITLNNNNIEWITSDIIKKMYQLSVDSNNTISFSGYLKSPIGYTNQVLYLNNTFGPELRVEATKWYMEFKDPEIENVLKYTNVGDGSGVDQLLFTTVSRITNSGDIFKNNTSITSFSELCMSSINTLPNFYGCTNLQTIGIPKGGCNTYKDYFYSVHLSNVFVDSPDDLSLINREDISSWGNVFNADLSGTYHIYSYHTGSEIRDITAKTLVSDYSVWDNSGNFDLDSLTVYCSGNMYGNCFKFSTITKVFLMSGCTGMTYHNFEGSTVQLIYIPETFTTWGNDVFKGKSPNTGIFMSTTPFNRTGGSIPEKFYVPDSSISDWESSYGPSSYWKRTIGTLSQWANIKEENKEDLEFMGCTVTGSTGNWTVTPPTA